MIALTLIVAAFAQSDAPPRFRVYDARDKTQIAGAMLELWTEDGAKPLGPTARVAVLHSGADGTGEFAWEIGGIRGENVRVSRAGYASHSVTLGDLEEGVELYPAAPLAGRVVDLDGRPVARALVRSRETCAHAVSAAETWTDADGRFLLTDCPADPQHAELEVLPREHVPLAGLEIDALRRLQARDGTFDLHVARRPALRVTALDLEGRPLAGRRLAYTAPPFLTAWTDAKGVATFVPPPQGHASLTLLGPGETQFFPIGPVPDSGALRARLYDASVPKKHSTHLKLDLAAALESGDRLYARVTDSEGLTLEGNELRGLAPGPATLVVGQAFSPWIEETHAITIADGEQMLAFAPKRAPEIHVRLPEGPWATLMVQAGDLGFRVDLEGDSERALHVPPGVELVFVALSGDGELRRLRHPALSAGTTEIDLRTAETVVRAGTPRPPEPEER